MSTQHNKVMSFIAMVFLAISVSNMAQAQYNPDDVVFDRTDKKKIFFTPLINENSTLSNYEFYDDARKNANWAATETVQYPPASHNFGGTIVFYSQGTNYNNDWFFDAPAESTTGQGGYAGYEWFTYRSQISRSNSGIFCSVGADPSSCQSVVKTVSESKCTSQDISFGLSGASSFPIKHNAASTLGVTPSLGFSKGWSLCQTSAESLRCNGIPGHEVYFTTESINTFGEAETKREITVNMSGTNQAEIDRVMPLCEGAGGTFIRWPNSSQKRCNNARGIWKKWDFWPRREAPIVSLCRSRPSTG